MEIVYESDSSKGRCAQVCYLASSWLPRSPNTTNLAHGDRQVAEKTEAAIRFRGRKQVQRAGTAIRYSDRRQGQWSGAVVRVREGVTATSGSFTIGK